MEGMGSRGGDEKIRGRGVFRRRGWRGWVVEEEMGSRGGDG